MKTLALVLALFPAIALAADPLEVGLAIKDHQFTQAEVKVPAGKKVKLVVSNQDNTPEEFESTQLNREKVIAGNSRASVYVGPLSPGKYPFWGEFNMSSARGVLVVE